MPAILIVEDDREVQKSLRALFAGNCEIAAAATGDEAIKCAMARPPSLIVLDIRLPDADGIDVAQRLRFLPKLESVPIVFLTGHVDSHVIEAARWMSHTALLRKPCRRAEVDRAIELAAAGSFDSGSRRSTVAAWTAPLSNSSESNAAVADPPRVRLARERQTQRMNAVSHPGNDDSERPAASEIALCPLIDDVCHDARSALFVVSEFAAQSASGLSGDEQSESLRMLQVIQERTTELRVLFDLLHAARRIQDGRRPPRCEPAALAGLLDTIISDCEQLARRKACAVEASLDCLETAVDCDGDELRVLLLSLFSHLLSMARSSSTISWRVFTAAGGSAPNVQIVLRAQLHEESWNSPDDNGAPCKGDSCGHEAPRRTLATAIARRNRGAIAFTRQHHQLSASVTLPIRHDAAAHAVQTRPCLD